MKTLIILMSMLFISSSYSAVFDCRILDYGDPSGTIDPQMPTLVAAKKFNPKKEINFSVYYSLL